MTPTRFKARGQVRGLGTAKSFDHKTFTLTKATSASTGAGLASLEAFAVTFTATARGSVVRYRVPL